MFKVHVPMHLVHKNGLSLQAYKPCFMVFTGTWLMSSLFISKSLLPGLAAPELLIPELIQFFFRTCDLFFSVILYMYVNVCNCELYDILTTNDQ